MSNRILDCLDGRRSSFELSSHELRLLKKIEAGLRARSRDYGSSEALDRLCSPPSARSSRYPSNPSRPDASTSPDRSALSAFLERSARRRLKAG
ncbi:MAG: hypothetical protein ACOC8K_03935 [Gemmatimonadota bacterium]